MRIAIVDDIPEERALLRTRIERQLVSRNVHPDLSEFANGEDFLAAAKERPFTVSFLDIYMEGANGIETAKELRKTDSECLLVFILSSLEGWFLPPLLLTTP